jgi:RimJ/RimL family protein N-acetyltransferase
LLSKLRPIAAEFHSYYTCRMQASTIPLSVAVPLLDTERLLLRGHRIDDFPHSASMWADPSVIQHILGRPQTREESWFRLLRYIGHWALLGFGYWVLVEKETGNFIGEAGFSDYKRDIEPSLENVPEIGWVLSTRAQGKGLATEAVRAITAWGDAHFQTRTACIIAPGNTASFRVAEKCGYQEVLRTTYHGNPTVMLSRERRLSK